MKKYYALYVESNDVLIFDSEEERDEFVWHEWEVHPDCIGVQYLRIEKLIKGKEPRFNSDFGCMAILADNGGNNKKFA